MMLINKYYLT